MTAERRAMWAEWRRQLDGLPDGTTQWYHVVSMGSMLRCALDDLAELDATVQERDATIARLEGR